MDTYFDIYGDPWGVSGRKNGAAASGSRKSGRKKLFIRIALTGNIIGMLLTFQSGGDKVIHPDTVWKKRRQVLMKRNSKYL